MPTQNELIILQNLDLKTKIRKTKVRIREWYEFWGGNVYVSFSGGKDSTVLLDIVRSMYPEVKAVFSDTGLEFPEIRNFVKQFDNVVWLKPKMNFREIIKEYGYPVISKEVALAIYYARKNSSWAIKKLNGTGLKPDGTKSNYSSKKYKFLIDAPFKITSECCSMMKKKPFKVFQHETGLKPFIGTMADEGGQRKSAYKMTGCNAFKAEKSMPLGFWREQDIWEYIRTNNISYSKIYDMGYKRTGCMFCMFGAHLEKGINRFQRMQTTHPKQYEYCMRDTEQGGLGLKKVLDYINVPYLNNVDARKNMEGIQYQQFKII